MSSGVSIIIPVYNESAIIEQSISKLSGFLKGITAEYQIIIADNGSTDATMSISKALAASSPNISYTRLDRKTVGGAFWSGVEVAKFEKIITVDVDLSINLDFIKEANVLLDSYDIVVGSKIAGNQERSIIRSAGSKAYIKIANFFLNLPVTDFSLGAKGYRKSSIIKYKGMTSDWTGYVIELMTFAKKDGFKLTEIPVNCFDVRKSKFNIVHEGFYRYWHLLGLMLKRTIT